ISNLFDGYLGTKTIFFDNVLEIVKLVKVVFRTIRQQFKQSYKRIHPDLDLAFHKTLQKIKMLLMKIRILTQLVVNKAKSLATLYLEFNKMGTETQDIDVFLGHLQFLVFQKFDQFLFKGRIVQFVFDPDLQKVQKLPITGLV